MPKKLPWWGFLQLWSPRWGTGAVCHHVTVSPWLCAGGSGLLVVPHVAHCALGAPIAGGSVPTLHPHSWGPWVPGAQGLLDFCPLHSRCCGSHPASHVFVLWPWWDALLTNAGPCRRLFAQLGVGTDRCQLGGFVPRGFEQHFLSLVLRNHRWRTMRCLS